MDPVGARLVGRVHRRDVVVRGELRVSIPDQVKFVLFAGIVVFRFVRVLT